MRRRLAHERRSEAAPIGCFVIDLVPPACKIVGLPVTRQGCSLTRSRPSGIPPSKGLTTVQQTNLRRLARVQQDEALGEEGLDRSRDDRR